jgi:hypothetical protein
MPVDIYSGRYSGYTFTYFTKKTPISSEMEGIGLSSYVPGHDPVDKNNWSNSTVNSYSFTTPSTDDFAINGISLVDDTSYNDLTDLRGDAGNLQLRATGDAADFGFVEGKLMTAWSYEEDPSEAFDIRSEMMWAPAYDVTGHEDTVITPGAFSVTDTRAINYHFFPKFRKVNTLVISGLPGFLVNSTTPFLDANSDFTYTCFRSVIGMGSQISMVLGGDTAAATGWTLMANLSNEDLEVGPARVFPYEINRARKQYLNVAIMPDTMSGKVLSTDWYGHYDVAEIDTLQNSYVRETWNALGCRIDFQYTAANTACVTYGDSGAMTAGSMERSHPVDTGNLAGTITEFNAQLNYSHDVSGIKNINWKISHASCYRLGPLNGFVKAGSSPHVLGNEVYGPIAIQTYFAQAPHPPSWDKAKYNVTNKVLYPVPHDGLERKSAYGVSTIIATPDCTAPLDGPQHNPQERRDHIEAAESNIYRMYWGPLPSTGESLPTALADQEAAMRVYYGTNTYSLMWAFMQLSNRVKVLQSAWTYDDTPKEARIRVQQAKKFNPEDFTGIKAGLTQMALDNKPIDTLLGPSEQFNPRIREWGDRDEGEFIIDGVYHGDRDPYG